MVLHGVLRTAETKQNIYKGFEEQTCLSVVSKHVICNGSTYGRVKGEVSILIFITLVSMLSIQSRTKSGCPERISASDDGSYNCTLASIWHSGYIIEKCFLRHNAFGVPTSSLVATACRFSDDSETFQHIICLVNVHLL